MSSEKPQVVHRRDYRPPDYRIDAVELDFDLREDETLVRARLAVRREPVLLGDAPPLVLAGQELETLSVAIDGRPLAAGEYAIGDEVARDPRAARALHARDAWCGSTPSATPRSRASTAAAATSAPSARRTASAASPGSSTAPT